MEDQQQQGENGKNPNGQNSNNGQNSTNGQNPRGETSGYHTHDSSVVQYRMNNAGGGAEFDDNFPPGYRFKPRDTELVVYYLGRKIFNEPLPPNRIIEVNLYKFNPDTLAENHKPLGENEWYFFTPREKKYKNGKRPNRAAGDGYWKATGADKRIEKDNVVLGFKKALVFYMGKPPKGDKTDWIMHEFRLEGSPRMIRSHTNDMRLDDWVLCRIYKKRDRSRSRLLSSRSSISQRDGSGLDDQQSDNEFQDNGAIGIEGEGSTMLPKGPGVIDMFGYSNQGGFFNSYDDIFLYHHQNQVGNHNVPYPQGRLNPGMTNHNGPYSQGMLNPGMPNHNGPYSQGVLNPGMHIDNVSDSQGRLPVPGVAQFSYNNTTWQSNPRTHHMIPTSNQNPNQAAESSAAAAAAAAAASRSFQSMKLEKLNEYQPDEFLNDPFVENCFDSDINNSQKL